MQLEFIEMICPPDFLDARNGLCEGDIYIERIIYNGLPEIVIVGADLRPGNREAYAAAEQKYREARAARRSSD